MKENKNRNVFILAEKSLINFIAISSRSSFNDRK